MAIFENFDWQRLDVWAIVGFAGLATINEKDRSACHLWLKRNDYTINSLDAGQGLAQAIPELGRMLNWENQFGYKLDAGKRNLDALRDGFEFDVPEVGGLVLEILGADSAWREDSDWLFGLLTIAQERSRWHLALGRRFFTVLVLPEKSSLVGVMIEKSVVPNPFWPSDNLTR